MDFRFKGREVSHRERNLMYTKACAAGLFFGSLGYYFQYHFRVNRSVPKFAAFAIFSYLAAGEWGKFVFLPI